jgi:hypothetical protein
MASENPLSHTRSLHSLEAQSNQRKKPSLATGPHGLAQRRLGDQGVLNQVNLLPHSMHPKPANAPHLLTPSESFERAHRQDDLTDRSEH